MAPDYTADAGKISGAAYTDNWGNRSTGRVRYGVQVHMNNLSGVGDSFSLGGLTSFEGLNNYDFGYNAYLGTSGLQGYVRHSRVNYTLGGDDFASLNATGKAVVTSAGLIKCLLTQDFNRLVIEDTTILDNAVMAMIRVGVERHVTDDTKLRKGFLDDA